MVAVAAVAGILVTGAFMLQSFVPPLKRHTDYYFNEMWPNQVPPVADAIAMRQRGRIGEETYFKYLEKEGFSKGTAKNFWTTAKQQLSGEALLLLNWRGEISDADYLVEMKKLGFEEATAKQFKISREYYPSPQDLVSWQAREVFEPKSVEKYQLKAELENVDRKPFYKAGMTDEQIDNYWVAHWQHPSLSMVFELLHRGFLTEPEVYDYYKLVEIPPYWRDMLTKAAYKPYTRVDVRRMYESGVLVESDVLQSYKDLGYDKDKAAKMTEWTIASTLQPERDLSRTMIEKGYETGMISGERAIALFMGLGYDEPESMLILNLKMYSIAESELDDKVSTIKTQFRRGILDEEEAIAALDLLDLAAIYRDKIIAEVQRNKQAEFKLPSKEDLIGFFQDKLIEEPEFVGYMKRLGFRETEINLYLRSFAA